jgi:type IV pilus assembly protein PilY1
MYRPTLSSSSARQRIPVTAWTRRLAATLVAGSAALTLSFGASAQAINDVPMAVKNNVPPNFMFMIDNSGSMTNIVPTAPYDASVNYTPVSNCSGTQVLGAGTTVYIRIATVSGIRRSFIRQGSNNYRHSTQTSTSTFGNNSFRCFSRNAEYSAHLLASSNNNTEPPGFLPSVYTGNYLNWYFGTTCSGNTPWSGSKKPLGACTGSVQTRMEIAISAGKKMVDTLPKPPSASADTSIRVGLSTYYAGNNGDGGTLLVPIKNLSFDDAVNTATHIGRTPLKTAIDALEPEGNTPLAETLADIGRYLATGYNGNIRTANQSSINIDNFFRQGGSSARESCLWWRTSSWGGDRNGCSSGSITSSNQSERPPITEWCQRSYVFMLTDGRSNQDLAFSGNPYLRDYDGDCSGALASNCTGSYDRKTNREYEGAGSDYFDDVAKALFDIDLRPDILDPRTDPDEPKKNNARTYVIGFADSQVQDDPLLISTATQGGGKFIGAADDTALEDALREVVTDAFRQDAASAAVAVANPQITVSDISYAPSYNSGAWYGDVEAFKLDTSTGAQIKPAIWSARSLLNGRSPITTAANGRKIATFNGSIGRPFQSGQFTTTHAPTLTANVINYVRGDRSLESATSATGFRVRDWLLGDIINAEPVVMNYTVTSGGSTETVPIVFQAANDGMLHAFDGRVDASVSTRGQELWAYVPRAVHNNLAELTDRLYAHRYYVDGTPAVAQVTGVGSTTRLLVGGLGKGGGAYYALDISSFQAADEAAVASKVKWEFSNVNLGYSFGTPLIVKTTAGWRVVVSSGYGNVTGGPNGNGDGRGRVWVLDPANGTVLATFDTAVGSTSNPAGLAHLSKPANIAPDADVRYVYGGDLLGNVWRFDIVDFTNLPVKIAEVRDPSGTPQPITAPVEVGPVSGQVSKYYVYVGTGKYLADTDVPGNAGATAVATQRQSMYGFIDDTAVALPATLSNFRNSNPTSCPTGGGDGALTCQVLTFDTASGRYRASTNALSATSRGWYVDLPPSTDVRLVNGRVTGKPAITTGGTLAFTVNVPTAAKCDPGGSSWFFQLSGQNGGAVLREAGGTTYFDAGFFLGNALASRVVVIQTAGNEEGDKVGLIQLSNRDVENLPINETKNPVGAPASWRRIYWRQLK